MSSPFQPEGPPPVQPGGGPWGPPGSQHPQHGANQEQGAGKGSPATVVLVLVIVAAVIIGGAIFLSNDDDDEAAGAGGAPVPEGTVPPGSLPGPEPDSGPGEGETGTPQGADGSVAVFCNEGFALGEEWGFSRPEEFAASAAAGIVVSEDDAPQYVAELRALTPPTEISADYFLVVDLIEWSLSDETGGSSPEGAYDAESRLSTYLDGNCDF